MGAPTQRQLPFSLEPALALQCPLPMPGFILPNTHTHTHSHRETTGFSTSRRVWDICEPHETQVSDWTSWHLKCEVTCTVSGLAETSHRAGRDNSSPHIHKPGLKSRALVNATFYHDGSSTHINSQTTKQLGKLERKLLRGPSYSGCLRCLCLPLSILRGRLWPDWKRQNIKLKEIQEEARKFPVPCWSPSFLSQSNPDFCLC